MIKYAIDPAIIAADVKRALTEDLDNKSDASATLIAPQLMAEAEIIAREPLLVCGIPWVDMVFATVDASIKLQWLTEEGAWLPEPKTLCLIRGPAAHILTAERTALNFLQTLSGTASTTYQYLLKLGDSKTQLLDTRKTIPGLRVAQKYAVACAGANNHRMGLFDAILIKENHIKACGSISNAVMRARPSNLFVEVEVQNLKELEEALEAKPNRILLDNFSLAMIDEAVEITKHRCALEVSGGVNLDNIAAIAATGVDYISVGALTKTVMAIDLSLLIRKLYE